MHEAKPSKTSEASDTKVYLAQGDPNVVRLRTLRIELRTLIARSQHEIVSYKGLSSVTRNGLLGLWGELWQMSRKLQTPSLELNVAWVFDDSMILVPVKEPANANAEGA